MRKNGESNRLSIFFVRNKIQKKTNVYLSKRIKFPHFKNLTLFSSFFPKTPICPKVVFCRKKAFFRKKMAYYFRKKKLA